MRIFTLLDEDAGDRARSICVRADGDVSVFDIGRKFRFRIEIDDWSSAWRILAQVVPAIAHAESVRDKIDRLVERVQTGWNPGYPDELDDDIPQRTLRQSHFAIDALAYPDEPGFYSLPTLLLGRNEAGQVQPTGKILWIAADRSWAVCEDAFWWLP